MHIAVARSISRFNFDTGDKLFLKTKIMDSADPIHILESKDGSFVVPNHIKEKVALMVAANGRDTAARVLGHDTSDYANLIMAGRLIMLDVTDNSPKSIKEYVKIFDHRLNDPCKDFMMSYCDYLQVDLD